MGVAVCWGIGEESGDMSILGYGNSVMHSQEDPAGVMKSVLSCSVGGRDGVTMTHYGYEAPTEPPLSYNKYIEFQWIDTPPF